MPRKYQGPLQPWKRSAKVYDDLPPKISIVDGNWCCENGCFENPCRCQSCPICGERNPEWILHCKPKEMGGVWIGPHCVMCDMEIWWRQNGIKF